MRRKRVYIPNRGSHDFTDALKFGELIFITEGVVNKFALDSFFRTCIESMKGAEAEDYLMITSLNSLCSIATGILARRFGIVNFLLFRGGKYVERRVDFDSLAHLM